RWPRRDLRPIARSEQHQSRARERPRGCERRGVPRDLPLPRGAASAVRRAQVGIVLFSVALAGAVFRGVRGAEARRIAVAEHEVAARSARRDADIAFFSRRVAADPIGAADRSRLAALYLQRARETANYEDYRRAERPARPPPYPRAAPHHHTPEALPPPLPPPHPPAAAPPPPAAP